MSTVFLFELVAIFRVKLHIHPATAMFAKMLGNLQKPKILIKLQL
jgi:hypothetical protein